MRFTATRLSFLCLLLLVAAESLCLAQAKPAEPEKTKINPADLDINLINGAIRRAVAALYKMEPNYLFPPEGAYHTYNQEARNAMGNHALAIWAMLAAGESYQNPPLYRRLNWVLSSDTTQVYDRGMRSTMLHQLPRTRWGPWIDRDGWWLNSALTKEGNYNASWAGEAATGNGDNANGQYGVLGLWNLQESGCTRISGDAWQRIYKYWCDAQEQTPGEAAAGWGVYSFAGSKGAANKGNANFYSRVSGPMTAGGVAILWSTERFLKGGSLPPSGRFDISPNLRKGIRWLDEHFDPNDKEESSDRYYYMWTIQRVGQATGYRSFNGVDWFRDITAQILTEQATDGTWRGDKGAMLSTGFAVLYLSKANYPSAIAKVRFRTRGADGKPSDAAWNNRPYDIWNFADYASDEYETTITWQINELSQPVYSLLESPLLYVSTDQAFNLTEPEFQNLKNYIEAGGMLVTNQEGTTGDAIKSFRDLSVRLFGREFEELKKDHPFTQLYDVHQNLGRGVQMRVVHNGVRPLMVHFIKDIGKGLQASDLRSEGFVALSNLYLYATGMNPRRSRLENNYVVARNISPANTVKAARIKFAGAYNVEPNADKQLAAILANQANVRMQISDARPQELGSHQIAFMGMLGDAQISDDDAAALRKWVEGGGTLWIDAVTGSDAARKAVLEAYGKIAPNVIAAPMLRDHAILTGKDLAGGYDNSKVRYRFYALNRMGPIATARLLNTQLNGRTAIVLALDDVTCGLAGLDHWAIFGYSPEASRKLVVNGVLDAMRNPVPDPAKPAMTFAQQAVARPVAEPSPATAEPAPATTETPATAPAKAE